MSDFDSSLDRDRRPIILWNGLPIHSSTLLVGIHAAALLIWTVVFAVHHPYLPLLFAFSSEAVLHGYLWQPFTYALVHEPDGVIWFAVEMYMLWAFGRELERFFGRKVFWQLYCLLWLVPPVVLLGTAWSGPQMLEGSRSLHFTLFVAFATLYPQAQMLFGMTAKWVALILVAASAIQCVAFNAFTELLVLGVSTASAYLFVRYQRGELAFPQLRVPGRAPKFRVVPRLKPPMQRVKLVSSAASMDDVDALLDKIARTGLNSLSPTERARLERASADLKKRPEPL